MVNTSVEPEHDDRPVTAAVSRPAIARLFDRWPRSTEPRGAAWIVGAVAAWVLLVWQAERVGFTLRVVAKVGAAPLVGSFEPPRWDRVPLAVAVGLALAWVLPRAAQRLPWKAMVAAMVVGGLVWGVSLAQMRPDPIDRYVDSRFEQPAVVPRVNEMGVGRFVRTYSDPEVLKEYPIHVQGHPVGAPLVFVALDRIGLGGIRDAAWFLLGLGALIAPAVLLSVREVAGERRARQAAPFLVLGPFVIWLVTSVDALFSFVGAWSIALLVLASSCRRSRAARVALAVGGGLLFCFGLHLSYGLLPLAAVPGLVVLIRRRWWVPVHAAFGALAVLLAFVLAGFWIKAGLDATHVRYQAGVADRRPFDYFALLGNPAAFLISTGPVALVAMARVRDRRIWLLGAGALVAVLASNASGLSKAEVERIWLPFVPWALVLTAGLWDRRRPAGSAVGNAPEVASAPSPPLVANAQETASAPEVAEASGDDGATWLVGPIDHEPVGRRVPALVQALIVLQVATALVVEAAVYTPW